MTLRQPPHNLQAEMAVLGSALIADEAARWAVGNLEAKHFYREEHGFVLQAIRWLLTDEQPVDLVSVCGYLKKLGHLGDCGGPDAILAMQNSVAIAAHFEHYGREVLRYYYDREMMNIGLRLSDLADSDDLDSRDKLLQSLYDTAKSRDGLSGKTGMTMNEALHASIDDMEKGPADLVRTGIIQIDKIIGGIAPGDLFVIGARPGMGKTIMCLTFAMNMARDGKKVAFFSGEMEAAQLVKRAISSRSGVPHWKLREHRFQGNDMRLVLNAADQLKGLPLVFCDKPSPSLRDINSFSDANKADIVVIDYLTRCSLPHAESFRLSVNAFVKATKNMTRETGRRTILAAQINRASDKTPDKMPTLSDLSESGAIEQESDFVGLLYQETAEKNKDDSALQFIIAKGRGTGTGIATLPWHKPTLRIGQENTCEQSQFDGRLKAANDVGGE
jgi:replicative DNA helicase